LVDLLRGIQAKPAIANGRTARLLLLPSPCSRHEAGAIHSYLRRNVPAITQAAYRPPTSPAFAGPVLLVLHRQGEVVEGSAHKGSQSDSSESKSSSSLHAPEHVPVIVNQVFPPLRVVPAVRAFLAEGEQGTRSRRPQAKAILVRTRALAAPGMSRSRAIAL
jgi:hypothetical protein